MTSIYENFKKEWAITHKMLRGLNIDPNKDFEEMTIGEAGRICDALDINFGDLLD